jgi:hypothetical protein
VLSCWKEKGLGDGIGRKVEEEEKKNGRFWGVQKGIKCSGIDEKVFVWDTSSGIAIASELLRLT